MMKDNDNDLFRRSVQDVKPLQHDKIPRQPAPAQQPVQRSRSTSPALESSQPAWAKPITSKQVKAVDATERVSFHRAGIQKRKLRQLQQGKVATEASIDLHGHSADSAEQMLVGFISQAYQRNCRCVVIVHGKGAGIVKSRVIAWLSQCPIILAYCSTPPQHGGSGALYALLQKKG